MNMKLRVVRCRAKLGSAVEVYGAIYSLFVVIAVLLCLCQSEVDVGA